MTDNVENLVLEQLRAIRSILGEHGDRLNRIELRLSAIEQTLGSLYALSGSDRETISAIIRRVERIERRLELSDHPT
jgi:lactam utilization protein B